MQRNKKMYYIKEFDPWHSSYCTCPPKYSLNPYTGCDHSCIYCYITSYIPNAFHVRTKKDFFRKLQKDIKKMDKNKIVSLSNSSDPYPTVEKKLRITRKTLQLLSNNKLKYQIITKSTLVTRDIDILQQSKCCVAITVTTFKEKTAKKLEPYAPSPNKRINALKKLHNNNIPTVVRIDPIIPFLNEKELEIIVEKISFVDHIVASTFKPRYDSWKRFKKVFPDTAETLEEYYFKEGEKINNSWYLPKELRFKIISKVKKIAEEKGISFGSCRENFYSMNSISCDGSHLIVK